MKLIKYSLKELLDNGQSISSTPENIQCWVDLPLVGTQQKRSGNHENKSANLKECKTNYRVCKTNLDNRILYSIRTVSYDEQGTISHISRCPSVVEVHENYDDNCIALMEENIRSYLNALKRPIISLIDFEDYLEM